MSLLVGVDVGGTKCAVTIIDTAGSTVARSWSEHGGGRRLPLAEIVALEATALLAAHAIPIDHIGAFGVAIAGLVAADHSTVVRAPTLGAVDLDLGKHLAAHLGRPVHVVNDANASLYGHVRLVAAERGPPVNGGAADGREVLLLLALGTGIGGSIMVGDRLVVGRSGYAAELGHVPVDFADPRVCLCGASGCVEQFASARGIAELAARTPPSPESRSRLAAMGSPEPYSARAIVAAAAEADPWATSLLGHAGTMLGRALVTLCVTLDPGTVIISGGFGNAAAPWLVPHAQAELERRWPYARERPLPPLRWDIIGPHAGATGAALLAMAEQDEGHR